MQKKQKQIEEEDILDQLFFDVNYSEAMNTAVDSTQDSVDNKLKDNFFDGGSHNIDNGHK